MEILVWLVLGVLAGVAALFAVYRAMPNTAMEWVGAVLVGLIGGWIGGLLFNLLGLQTANWFGSLVVAFVGGVIVLMLLRRMAPGAHA
jgi:uncharacterized membrane protein YeaQ/YmgE (transglycosylase-associated protein family)